jgi:hypothetical protein
MSPPRADGKAASCGASALTALPSVGRQMQAQKMLALLRQIFYNNSYRFK